MTVPGLALGHPVDGPARAVPGLFPTEAVALPVGQRAWSQTPDGGGLLPGWTGLHAAVTDAAAGQVLAPRPQRRRRAWYAVLAVVAATAVVLVVALAVAPSWRGGTADKDGQAIAVTGLQSTSAAVPTRSSTVRTVTVTAPPTATGPATAPSGVRPTARPTAPGGTSPRPTPPATTAPRSTPARTTTARTTPARPTPPTRTAAPALPLGVPAREIACSAGYVVQLASEFDAAAFKARVAQLRAAGRLPAGALAATTARSCKIFTSQRNTVVLWAGPFADRYAGCAVRLAGPADAFIKGANTSTSREYVSCLCPAAAAGLPRYGTIGQQGVWVGELQRVLGNRLNISIGDLDGHWGQFTTGTRAAVERFQASAGLPPSGAVDARTWAALRSAQC